MSTNVRRVAFIVGMFPAASETFITSQIAGLLERGLDVQVFSFRCGDTAYAAVAYTDHRMVELTTYLDFPQRWGKRAVVASKAAFSLLRRNPMALVRALNVFRYGADAWSLKLLCWAGPLADLEADIVHCHFGTVADQFRVLRHVLGLHQPWLTTLYGYDVSQVPKQKGVAVYRNLARECPRFFVMSEDMKQRVVALGFKSEKVLVHPVGIDPDSCEFRERQDHVDPICLAIVARLVEKKGVDDLIRALAEARTRTARKFHCTIIGDGPLRQRLHGLAGELRVDDLIDWKGYMRQEDMLRELERADIYVQPSKTSSTGDME